MDKIYLSPPHINGNEFLNVKNTFDSNWISTVGSNISEFENKITEYTKSKHAIVLNSGTSAIHLALKSLGVSKGDYVITSSLTFAGTINPIKYLGAHPIFVDSEAVYWNMDVHLLEHAILNAPKKPKAILPVHIYGISSEMVAIKQIADTYDIPILEDAAESMGSLYDNKHTGTFGNLGVYSFNGNKLLTTGGGGCVITDDDSHNEYIRYISNQAKSDKDYYWHEEVGYNYRLSNVLAAIGSGQIDLIEDKINKKRNINKIYRKELDGIIKFQDERESDRSNMWLSCGLISNKFNPQELISFLNKKNIEARRIWYPMHNQPIFKNEISYINGISDLIFNHGICLPSGCSLTEEQQLYVIDNIKKFIYE